MTRSFIPHKCHSAIGVFGALSVASACLVPGTVAEGMAQISPSTEPKVSVEHPTGEFTVAVRLDNGALAGCGLLRTARLLFDGKVLIPSEVWRPS